MESTYGCDGVGAHTFRHSVYKSICRCREEMSLDELWYEEIRVKGAKRCDEKISTANTVSCSVYDLRSRHGAHTNAHTTEYAGVRLIIRLINQYFI